MNPEVIKRPNTNLRAKLLAFAALLVAACLITGPAVAKKPELPQTTTDGLTLIKQTKSRYVYAADDADISKYTKVMIIDCAVAFKKNWQRDYNRESISLDHRVSDSDVARMKKDLAEEFKKEFTKVMTDKGHEVVTEPGPDVLILRPALLNVVANAPDTRSASMSRTYVADPGEMTLYLELYDSVSSAIIARIVDAQDAGRGAPVMSYSNRVTNIAAADRLLRGWATELAEHLGATTEEAKAGDES